MLEWKHVPLSLAKDLICSTGVELVNRSDFQSEAGLLSHLPEHSCVPTDWFRNRISSSCCQFAMCSLKFNPLTPRWDYRHKPPCLAFRPFFIKRSSRAQMWLEPWVRTVLSSRVTLRCVLFKAVAYFSSKTHMFLLIPWSLLSKPP